MSSRISETFARLKAGGEKGLVVYLTAGDPTPAASLEYLKAAADAGADILEVGVPFSDPTADGPTIQAASQRALEGGMTVHRVLDLVAGFRKTHKTPIVLFGYYNPLFRYGIPALCRDARKVGVDGILVVDLPVEEWGEMAPQVREAGLDWIPLAAPTSGAERIRRIAEAGSGFLYLISVTGITGTRTALPPEVASWTRQVRRTIRLPLAVGFGISSPQMAKGAVAHADAAIVGSACVKIVERHGAKAEGPRELHRFVASIKKALR
ncbi:MAG TPA: tryptophan synthase subunit alpha [Candidatus Deferrimicrobiaceae bacterium]